MTAPAGYAREHACRRCRRPTRQVRAGHENTSKPLAEYWRCTACGLVLLTLHDLKDAEWLCQTTADAYMRSRSIHDSGDVRSVERDDLYQAMLVALWELYLYWTPALCVSFQRFVSSGILVKRGLVQYLRDQKGRTAPKPHAIAESLDAPAFIRHESDIEGDQRDQYAGPGRDRLGSVAGAGAGCLPSDSDAALRRVYAEADRRLAERERSVGLSRAELLA